jgi:WD40 repeat protein
MDRFFIGVRLSQFLDYRKPHRNLVRLPIGKIKLTRSHMLEVLAMSSLTGLLIRRLFSLSSRGKTIYLRNQFRLMMRVISRRHLPMSFHLSPGGIMTLYTRSLKYDPPTGILAIGNERGDVIIRLPDGSRISHRMPNYVAGVSILSPSLISICGPLNHATIFTITNDTLSHVVDLHHTNDANCACGHPVLGLIATGSRDRTVKIWSLGPQGASQCLDLREHQSHVDCVSFHPKLPWLASSSSDGKVIFTVLSPDGRNVLSSKTLEAHYEGKILKRHHEGYTPLEFHPDPEKTLLISAGKYGWIIIWSISIGPSNEILTEDLVFYAPTLENSWISSISIHPMYPMILLGSGHNLLERENNVPLLICLSGDFMKVQHIMELKMDECGRGKGTVRSVFLPDGTIFATYYKSEETLTLRLRN